MGSLTGRIAIVTGASRRMGIGSELGKGIAKKLQNENVLVQVWKSICADINATNRIINEVVSVLGTPSILINNATHSTRDGYENLNAETLDAHYVVNVRGTCLLCVEFARRLISPLGDESSI